MDGILYQDLLHDLMILLDVEFLLLWMLYLDLHVSYFSRCNVCCRTYGGWVVPKFWQRDICEWVSTWTRLLWGAFESSDILEGMCVYFQIRFMSERVVISRSNLIPILDFATLLECQICRPIWWIHLYRIGFWTCLDLWKGHWCCGFASQCW